MAVLAINKTQFDNLPMWKRLGIRRIMGNLELGNPAIFDANGTPVYVFEDDRFTALNVTLLGLGVSEIIAMSEPGNLDATVANFNTILTSFGIAANSAQFFGSVPATWTRAE